MNVPLISSTAPDAQMPGLAGRGADVADAPGFSDTLSQRRDQLQNAARPARTADAAAREGDVPANDESASRPLTPEETLALLAAGATLPLMGTAQAVARAEAAAAESGAAPNGRAVADQTARTNGRAPTDERISTATAADGDPQAPLRTDPRAALSQADAAVPAGARSRAESADAALVQVQASDAGAAPRERTAWEGMSDVSSTPATPRSVRAAADPLAAQAANSIPPGLAAASAMARQESSMAQAPGAGAESAMAQLAVSLPHALGQAAPGAHASPLGAGAPAVPVPLGDPAWPADFSRQVLTLIQDGRNGAHTAELRLNPPDLGPVRIVLHVSDSVTQALFVSPHAPVRHALENALPQLQQQLAQAGLSLGQADVSDHQPGQQQAFHSGNPQGRSDTGGMRFSLDGEALSPAAPVLADAVRPRAGGAPDALVDTFA